MSDTGPIPARPVPKKRTFGAALTLFFIALPVLGLSWLLYTSIILPRAITRELLDLLASERVAEVTAKIEPTSRANYGEAKIREWSAAVKGYRSVDWGRKSSLGTTRGGKTVASANGYLKYEGTTAERSFSLSVVKIDGEWYVSSFSVGRLAEPY